MMTIVKDVERMPEYAKCSADGMQSKFYNPDNNCWYKQDYLGTEGLSEYVSSLLLEDSNIEHVDYQPCRFKNNKKTVVGCCSENFLKPGERLISTYELIKKHKNIDIADEIVPMEVEDRIKYYVDTIVEITGIQDFGQYLTKLLQLDAVIKNDDRHFNNISVIQAEDGSYKVAPVYDNGGAFLSDQYTYGDDLSKDEIYKQMDAVQAKPFSVDFDAQLDACESLYPTRLQLKKDICINKEILPCFYKESDIQKVEEMIRQGQRKYGYLFPSPVKEKPAELDNNHLPENGLDC